MREDDLKTLLKQAALLYDEPVDDLRLSVLESKIVFSAVAQKQCSARHSLRWGYAFSGLPFSAGPFAAMACVLFLFGVATGHTVSSLPAASFSSTPPTLMTLATVSPWQALE